MRQGSQQVKVVFRDLGLCFLKVGDPVAGVDYSGVVPPPEGIAYIRETKRSQFPGQRHGLHEYHKWMVSIYVSQCAAGGVI